jgi:hypothetical protein
MKFLGGVKKKKRQKLCKTCKTISVELLYLKLTNSKKDEEAQKMRRSKVALFPLCLQTLGLLR